MLPDLPVPSVGPGQQQPVGARDGLAVQRGPLGTGGLAVTTLFTLIYLNV